MQGLDKRRAGLEIRSIVLCRPLGGTRYHRYLIVQLINSTVQDVSRKEDVGYEAVNRAIERHIDTRVN